MLIKKILTLSVILVLIGLVMQSAIADNNYIKPISKGKTLYVGGSGPNNYTEIQKAIDDAYFGDTVFVYDDSSPYSERLLIYKPINLIGEDKNTTIIDGYGRTVIEITRDFVNVSGFTIQKSGYDEYCAGFYINSNNNVIKDNILKLNEFGIYLNKCSNNVIKDNTIWYNERAGICLYESIKNEITRNNIVINDDFGVWLDEFSKFNTISYNEISNNYFGIALYDSSFNKIIGNTIDLNYIYGIDIASSNSNIIKGNIFSNSTYFGITMSNSMFNIIKKNTIISIKDLGIYFDFSSFNFFIKNNLQNNKIDAYFGVSFRNHWMQNYWNKTRILPKIIVGLFGYTYDWKEIYLYNIDWRPALKPNDIEV